MLSDEQQAFILKFLMKARKPVTARTVYLALMGAKGKITLCIKGNGVVQQKHVDQYLDYITRKGLVLKQEDGEETIWSATRLVMQIINGLKPLPTFDVSDHG